MNNNYYNPQGNQYYQQQNAQYFMMKQQIAYAKKEQRKELVKVGFVLGSAIIVYLLLQSVWGSMISALGLYDAYQNSVMFKYAFNIIGVDLLSLLPAFGIAALILKRNFTGELVPTKKVGKLKATAWVFFGMGCTIVANYLVSVMMAFVKNVLGYELTQNNYGNSDDILTYIVMFVATAIAPAIFEEFSFRCCTLGVLKKYGKGFAVFMVSIIFGLIHGNVIQFVFAFLVGLILAYITVQTDNVIIAMFIHGLNNARSAVSDIITTAANEKLANTVSTIIMIIFVVLAIIALIYLLYTKSFAMEKKMKSLYDNNFGTKIACMIPGMIVPFAILIALTKQYVTKI